MDNTTINPKTCTWDWKSFFQRSTLELGQKDENTGKLIDFDWSADGRRAVGRTVNGFYVFAKQIPSNYQEASDCPPWDQLSFFNGETYNSKQFYSCSCSQGILGARCRHLANLMLHLEKEHGPFVFTETEEELQARIRAEEEERERKHREAEERKEKLRLELCSGTLGVSNELGKLASLVSPLAFGNVGGYRHSASAHLIRQGELLLRGQFAQQDVGVSRRFHCFAPYQQVLVISRIHFEKCIPNAENLN